jgi:membrane protease YdiL (CAAX protease family)
MTQKAAFPGPLGAAGLVLAMWAMQILFGVVLHAAGVSELSTDALVWSAVASEAVVVAAYLARTHSSFANVLHPAPHSMAATSGLIAPAVLLVAPALFVLACFADDAVRMVFPMSESERKGFEALLSGGPWTFLAMVVIGPVAEEMLFRGIILRGFLAKVPARRAVFLSALLFGIAHLNVYQLVSATLLGLPLGWLYVRFRSVLPGIFLHAAMNGLSIVIGNLTRADLPTSELPMWFLLGSLAAFFAGARLFVVLTRLRQSQA